MNTGPACSTGLERRSTSSPHLSGRKLDYEADSGVVVLTGKVNSYFQKQMAQEAIRRVDGVELIDNRLEVDWA